MTRLGLRLWAMMVGVGVGAVTELVWMLNGNILVFLVWFRLGCFQRIRANPTGENQARMNPPQYPTAFKFSIHCGVTASRAVASRLARV